MPDTIWILIITAVGLSVVFILLGMIFKLWKNEEKKKSASKKKTTPVRTEKAFLIERLCEERRKINDDDTITITARYRLVYKIRGQRMEFAVPKKIYSQIPDDVNGILTFRGENFIRFEYSGGIVEK